MIHLGVRHINQGVSHETKRSQQNAGKWKTFNFSSKNKAEEQKGWI